MDRRTLVRTGLVGLLGAIVAPPISPARAGAPNPIDSPLAGALFYTAVRPGRWAGKQDSHVPRVERNGAAIEVTTPHEMDGFVHYIVKHMVLDERLDVIGETLFDPGVDAPISRHDIRGLQNVVYALSLCNQHDIWVTAFDL